jgi:putative transposase
VDTPHHITQRGNGRRFVLEPDADRLVYLQLLRHYCQLHQVALAGYCLMSNHVHLIAAPRRADSLALALEQAHGRFAAYFNARRLSSGHVWQGRFYSCPLDEPHLWTALCYVEINPVRAGLAEAPEAFAWSSAAAHCSGAGDGVLDLTFWREVWTPTAWSRHLRAATDESEAAEIHRNTHTGRPLGASAFVASLEKALNRKLAPARGGRPPKQERDQRQQLLTFTNG